MVFNLNKELEKEQKRLEDEMKKCKCGNGVNVILGDCNLCDVRYAKHEGISFSGHKFEEFIEIITEDLNQILMYQSCDLENDGVLWVKYRKLRQFLDRINKVVKRGKAE